MTTAIEYWRNRVKTNKEQSSRVQRQASWTPNDFWEPLESHLKADPYRTDDPVLNRLNLVVTSNTSVLDVGGGAGKFALPLALRAKHVTVTEPSKGLANAIRRSAEEAGIKNISVINDSWEDAIVETADVVLCAHVVHEVVEVETFIRKLHSQARERVMLLESMESPMSLLSPLWKAVHGDDLELPPAIPDLLKVLWEMEIYPDQEMFDATSPETIESREAALHLLRQMLYVRPDTEQDRSLQTVMHQYLTQIPQGFGLKRSRLRRQALISWIPS
jgi:SAM-dependent methyltransferase